MITTARCATMVPTKDVGRARRFYEEVLGFTAEREMVDGSIMYRAGEGSTFVLYPSQFAGTSQATLCCFRVDDIENEVAALRTKGVTFEEYDMPGLVTEDGIAWMENDLAGSWFRDPDGNIIALAQLAPVDAASMSSRSTITA